MAYYSPVGPYFLFTYASLWCHDSLVLWVFRLAWPYITKYIWLRVHRFLVEPFLSRPPSTLHNNPNINSMLMTHGASSYRLQFNCIGWRRNFSFVWWTRFTNLREINWNWTDNRYSDAERSDHHSNKKIISVLKVMGGLSSSLLHWENAELCCNAKACPPTRWTLRPERHAHKPLSLTLRFAAESWCHS